MAWQDVATQMLGAQAPEVIQRLNAINPNYDWSRAIQSYVPVLNQAYGTDWQDPNRGSSAGIVSVLTQKAQEDGQTWAQSALPGAKQAQAQEEAEIQRAQNPPDEGLFGDLGPLAQLAALIPGPQQPFLLAANAANAASQGNWIGAGLNAFGAYNGGIGNSISKLGDMFSSSTSTPYTYTASDGVGGGSSFDVFGDSDMDYDSWADFGGEYTDPGYNYPDMNYEGNAVYDGPQLPNVDDYSNGYGNAPNAPVNFGDFQTSMGSSGFWDTLQKYGPQAAMRVLGGPSNSSGLSSMFGGSGTSAMGGYQFPWGQAIGSLVGAYRANKSAETLAEAMKYAADRADPFYSQRPQYQAQLPGAMQDYRDKADYYDRGYNELSGRLDSGFNKMQGEYRTQYNDAARGYQTGFDSLFGEQQAQNKRMQDPNYWNKDSLLAGLNDMAVNDTSRKLASQGYNMSGNVPVEVAQRLQNNNATYVPGFMNAITQNQNTALGGYNTNTNNQLGNLNQSAATNLGQYNQNAGNQLSGYNNNAKTGIDASYNRVNTLGGWAGAGFGPGAAGTVAGQGAMAGAGLQNQLYGNLGAGFQSALNGSQPNLAQQLQGQQPNKSLADVFKGWSF